MRLHQALWFFWLVSFASCNFIKKDSNSPFLGRKLGSLVVNQKRVGYSKSFHMRDIAHSFRILACFLLEYQSLCDHANHAISAPFFVPTKLPLTYDQTIRECSHHDAFLPLIDSHQTSDLLLSLMVKENVQQTFSAHTANRPNDETFRVVGHRNRTIWDNDIQICGGNASVLWRNSYVTYSRDGHIVRLCRVAGLTGNSTKFIPICQRRTIIPLKDSMTCHGTFTKLTRLVEREFNLFSSFYSSSSSFSNQNMTTIRNSLEQEAFSCVKPGRAKRFAAAVVMGGLTGLMSLAALISTGAAHSRIDGLSSRLEEQQLEINAVKHTISGFNFNFRKIEKITANLTSELNTLAAKTQSGLDNLEQAINFVRSENTIMNMLSEIRHYLVRFQTIYVNSLQGVTTELSLTENDIQTMLQQSVVAHGQAISTDRKFFTTAIKIRASEFLLEVQSPLIPVNLYEFSRVTPLPVFRNNRTFLPNIVYQFVGVNAMTRKVTLFRENPCTNAKSLHDVCNIAAVERDYDDYTCGVSQIVSPRAQPCSFIESPDTEPFFQAADRHTIVYSVPRETKATIHCPNSSEPVLLKGIDSLLVQENCDVTIEGAHASMSFPNPELLLTEEALAPFDVVLMSLGRNKIENLNFSVQIDNSLSLVDLPYNGLFTTQAPLFTTSAIAGIIFVAFGLLVTTCCICSIKRKALRQRRILRNTGIDGLGDEQISEVRHLLENDLQAFRRSLASQAQFERMLDDIHAQQQSQRQNIYDLPPPPPPLPSHPHQPQPTAQLMSTAVKSREANDPDYLPMA